MNIVSSGEQERRMLLSLNKTAYGITILKLSSVNVM